MENGLIEICAVSRSYRGAASVNYDELLITDSLTPAKWNLFIVGSTRRIN